MSFRGREFTPGQSSLPPGTQLNGTYEIGDLINAGGMGEVYRGHNIATGDPVAIKVVLPEYAADQLILDLFRKEARILNQLAHDAIVRYYGFASDRDINRSYMAMEFVEGLSLAERMRSGPLSVAEVSGLRSRVADGLHKAHELGIIHRDISPENVILQGGLVSRAKIIDFGIAKSTALASEGTLIGTSFAGRYNFASPEQVGMFRPATVSPKSDIYSFGLVLAAALLGQPIDMSGTMAEIMEKRAVVPDLSAIPAPMRDLLTAMLQPNPANRLANMAEVRDWPVETGEETVIAPRVSSRPAPPPPHSAPRPGGSKRPMPIKLESKRPPKLPPVRRDEFSDASGLGSRIGLWISIGVLVTVLAGAAGGWFYVKSRVNQLQPPQEKPAVAKVEPRIEPQPEEQPAETPVTPEPTTVTPAEPQVAPPPAPTETVEPATEPPTTVTEPVTPPPPAESSKTDVAVQTPEPDVTEPTPTPPPPDASDFSSSVDLTNFVFNYDGGECFFAWPDDVRKDSARISGYAASEAPFNSFLSDFMAVSGIPDPSININVRKVSSGQCVVVDTIRQLARGKAPKPNLRIEKQTVSIGETLAGSVILPGRHLELLFVSEKGETYKATSLLKDGTFNIPMKQKKPPGSESPLPQLVIVVSSPEPLNSLVEVNMTAPAAAAEVFPALAKEARENGKVSVAMTLIKLIVPSE